MTKEITFKIGMTCDGCKGAVTKILAKIDGIVILYAENISSCVYYDKICDSLKIT